MEAFDSIKANAMNTWAQQAVRTQHAADAAWRREAESRLQRGGRHRPLRTQRCYPVSMKTGFINRLALQNQVNQTLRERVAMVRGNFAVVSAPGQGTTIRAQIPFHNGA
jgi:hypothetical protein